MSGDTTEIPENARFDESALTDWMKANVDGFSGPLTITKFAGGQSNPTFKLTTPGGKYVMRRKPPGQLLKGAHAVDREARVMSALGAQGFPVPKIHALCTDDTVIGSWFYVMDMVEGRNFWNSGFPEVPKSERAAYIDAMNATQAALHNFDPDAIGLGDYGRKGGFVERQVALWTRQYQADELAGRNPDLDFLVEWLPQNLPPEGETRIAHGDYRVDNMIFHPERPEVIAVLDWELSTLGDPLSDFAYHMMMYRVPAAMPWGLAGRDVVAEGLPSEAEYVAAYARRTGRSEVPHLETYIAFNLFRFAAIMHGIKGRMLRGNASSPDAELLVGMLDEFASIARSVAEKA